MSMIDEKLSKEMRWRVVVDICFFRIFARKKKNNMVAFALYRLPYANEYVRAVQHKGEVEELHRYTELNGKSGYVMAPFSASADVPILLMHPDETTTHNVNDEIKRFNDLHESIAVVENERQEQMERNRYAIDFANFHTQIMNGTFRKIVLARCKEIRTQENVNAEMLFLKACERYPHVHRLGEYAPKRNVDDGNARNPLGRQRKAMAHDGFGWYDETERRFEGLRYSVWRRFKDYLLVGKRHRGTTSCGYVYQ